MKKKSKDNVKDKTDLKHHNLEFTDEPVEEINRPITDKEINREEEEEGITAEELNTLEADDIDNQAYALNTVETDLKQDEDNLPDEDWIEDLPDNDIEDTDDEYQRK